MSSVELERVVLEGVQGLSEVGVLPCWPPMHDPASLPASFPLAVATAGHHAKAQLIRPHHVILCMHIPPHNLLLVGCISQAAAVGVPTPGGGPEQLVLFLVAKPGAGEASSSGSNKGSSSTAKALQQACQEAIRTRLNPLFRVSQVQLVEGLPRNASNKVMRRVLRDQLMQGKGADTGAGSGGTGAGAAPRAKL